MNKNFKRVIVGILALTVLCMSTVAMANSWKQVGYDISDDAISNGEYACIYQEYDENGIATGNVKTGSQVYDLNMDLPAFAKTVSLGANFIDRTHTCSLAPIGSFFFVNHDLLPAHDCGNLEYGQLFLDGKVQNKAVATGAYGEVEYRWTNLFWEKAAPYKIYQKKEANLPGLGWYTDESYPTRYSGENETVVVTQPQVYIDNNTIPFEGDATGYEYLFDKTVDKLYQRKLTGTTMPITVIDDFTYPLTNGCFTDGLKAEPKWIDAGYEEVAPYREYQILALDGYLMDGSKIVIETNDPKNPMVIQKPYIYRYTGGFAKPVITYTDYKIETGLYDAATRTAPVFATVVLDGKKTSVDVMTGDFATLEYSEVFDSETALTSMAAKFVARVNQNGTVVLMQSAILPNEVFDVTSGNITTGFIPVQVVPQVVADFVY